MKHVRHTLFALTLALCASNALAMMGYNKDNDHNNNNNNNHNHLPMQNANPVWNDERREKTRIELGNIRKEFSHQALQWKEKIVDPACPGHQIFKKACQELAEWYKGELSALAKPNANDNAEQYNFLLEVEAKRIKKITDVLTHEKMLATVMNFQSPNGVYDGTEFLTTLLDHAVDGQPDLPAVVFAQCALEIDEQKAISAQIVKGAKDDMEKKKQKLKEISGQMKLLKYNYENLLHQLDAQNTKYSEILEKQKGKIKKFSKNNNNNNNNNNNENVESRLDVLKRTFRNAYDHVMDFLPYGSEANTALTAIGLTVVLLPVTVEAALYVFRMLGYFRTY